MEFMLGLNAQMCSDDLRVQTLLNGPAKTRRTAAVWMDTFPTGDITHVTMALESNLWCCSSSETHLKVISNLSNRNITCKAPPGGYLMCTVGSGYQHYPGRTIHSNGICADRDQDKYSDQHLIETTPETLEGVWSHAWIRCVYSSLTTSWMQVRCGRKSISVSASMSNSLNKKKERQNF